LAISLPTTNTSMAADCAENQIKLQSLKGVIERKKFLEKAVIECPQDAVLRYYYAYNLERLLKYTDALAQYEKVVSLDPSYAKAYFGMADMFKETGKNLSAINAYKKGLSLAPENVWAKRSLNEIQELSGKKRSSFEKESYQFEVQSKKTLPEGSEDENGAGAAEKTLPVPVQTNQKSTPAQRTQPAFAENEASLHDQIVEEEKKLQEKKDVFEAQVENRPIYFSRDSGYLTEDAMSFLDTEICPVLQSDALRESRFKVEGHSDDLGDLEVNMYISRLRAHTVMTYLITRCNIEPARLELSFSGPSKPLVPNTNEKNRSLNRRVEIRPIE